MEEMEGRARGILRDALFLHYMEDIGKVGGQVEAWLRAHGGWFRDSQQLYEPYVEDDDVKTVSEDPENALKEAYEAMVMLRLTFTTQDFEGSCSEEDVRKLRDDAVTWAGDLDCLRDAQHQVDTMNLHRELASAASSVAATFGGTSTVMPWNP
jgi:hypothetical protein